MSEPTTEAQEQRRVVIAEDEALIRLDLSEMLKELGYDVVGQASDGEQALSVLAEKRPDLAILDVRMPKLDGISVAQQVAEQRICPVIILTAVKERDQVERATEAGAMAYLLKPFDKEKLLPAIEIAVSRYDEMRALEEEVKTLSEQIETRKLVERAKGILQQKLSVTEPEAFRWIQKTAMDKRVQMRQVAQLLIDEAETLGSGSAEV